VTDLPAAVVPAGTIQRWGHARWDIENRGFNELATLWHMDHCFVHQVVAVEALLLTLALAFVLTHLFYTRNLKPPPGARSPAWPWPTDCAPTSRSGRARACGPRAPGRLTGRAS